MWRASLCHHDSTAVYIIQFCLKWSRLMLIFRCHVFICKVKSYVAFLYYCETAVVAQQWISILRCTDRHSRMYSVGVMLLLDSHSQQQGFYCLYAMPAQAVDISITGESLHVYLRVFAWGCTFPARLIVSNDSMCASHIHFLPNLDFNFCALMSAECGVSALFSIVTQHHCTLRPDKSLLLDFLSNSWYLSANFIF